MPAKPKLELKTNIESSALPLSRQIYTVLRDQIVSFQLEPFEQVSEIKIAQELGVSRTPVHEALARLSERGLIDVYPQRSTVVAPLRIDDLQKSQFLREALELALLRRAMDAPNRSTLVARLRAEIEVQTTFAKLGDMQRFYDSDEAFHGFIANHAGLPSIVAEIDRVKIHMDRFRRLVIKGLENLTEVLDQHRVIVDAIEAGDFIAAEQAMQTHLRRILNFAEHAMEQFPEFFAVAENTTLRRPTRRAKS